MTGQRHEVEVTIIDGDALVDTRRCRLVHLPDGRAAAVWRGWRSRYCRATVSTPPAMHGP